jgi:hypothetical protein
MTRIDPQINFNWGSGAPDPAVGEDNFSVRWTGEVEAAFTETYTFYTTTDDGVCLWINDQQIIDKWRKQSATEWSGTIDLVAGQTYSILMEYFENRVNAVAQMRWSSPRTPKQLIPQAVLSPPAEAQYGGGTGEPDDPYLIYTAEQMNAIGAEPNDWDKHFKLMADIDLSGFTGTDFNIIGYYISDDDNKPFTGFFDGSGKKISNFSYSCADINRIGLFGYVDDPNAEIKDLELIDPNVDAGTGDDVGSLVGYMDSGTIDGCYAQGGSVSGNEDVGGLVGLNKGLLNNCHSVGNVTGNYWVGGVVGVNGSKLDRCYSQGSVLGNLGVAGLVGYNVGTITDCYATGNVWGSQGVGGLVGYNDDGTITNCYANCYVTGGVSGNNWYFGGLVGSNFGTVSDCYAASSVSGELFVGGLVGRNNDKITRCYSVGSVTGRSGVGGLVGGNEEGTITNSFWDTQTSGQYKMCGNTGPEGSGCDNTNGKTTAEMQMASTFMNAGWDFVGQPDGPHDIWAESIDDGYPILSWQLPHRSGLPTFSGGTGSSDDSYLISTSEDLNGIGHNPRLMEEHFKLINDIDLSGIDFFMIGSELYPFGGVFDGNGKKISNFTYASTDEDLVGLFRYVEGATITELGLINPNVDGTTKTYVGSLVGFIRYGAIKGCYVRNGYVSGNFVVGGIVGRTYLSALSDCYSEGTVSGEKVIGGLVGQNYAGTISNCYSVGSVAGATEVGGLVGMNDFSLKQGFFQPGIITNCYATGSIEGQMCVGGLVGDNLGKITDSYATGDVVGFDRVGGLVGHNYLWIGELVIPPTISSCYASGSVLGIYMVGGLLGTDDGGTVTESFWDIENSGQITSDGGTGKTTAQMQMATTFLNAGWDFVDETANGTDDIWWILEGRDYPRLWWELFEE